MKKLFIILLLLLSACTTSDEFFLEEGEFRNFEEIEEDTYLVTCPEERDMIIGNEVHQVYTASSLDGINWVEEGYLIGGSVPEATYFDEKFILIIGFCMYESSDGINFESFEYSLIAENFTGSMGVDPTLMNDEGTLRLVLYAPNTDMNNPIDPSQIEGDHDFVEYRSSDGKTWKKFGTVLSLALGTDPDIVKYKDDVYLLTSQGQNSVVSIEDQNFSVLNDGKPAHALGGVPDSIVIGDELYSYVTSGSNVKIVKTSDLKNWEEVGIALEGEAASVVELPDGSYRMYYVKRVRAN